MKAAGTRVLVADDDPDMRDMIVSTLRADGYEVTEARDGLDLLLSMAAAAMEGRGYEAVISDLRMPVVGGLDAAERLRLATIETPLILMTAFSDALVRERVHRLRADLLEKPFDLDDLRVAVEHATRHAGR
ncbi:MAG TPA: response regulator [Polyangiaceae bacterium]